MDALFPAYDPTLTLIIAGGIIALGVLVAAIVFLRRDDGITSVVSVLMGMALMMFTFGVTNIIMDGSKAEARTAQTEWVESHGVSLTDDALDDLKFPEDRPDGDEDYGIAQVVRDKAIVDVHLAWEDEEFVLYGTDGQPLEVLER